MLPRLLEKLSKGWPKYLSDFSKVFEVVCDAWDISIGRVLSQKKYLIAYFSEKFGGSKLKYSTYDEEFYVVVQSLRHWWNYLLPQEFIIYSDHEPFDILIMVQSHSLLKSPRGGVNRWYS